MQLQTKVSLLLMIARFCSFMTIDSFKTTDFEGPKYILFQVCFAVVWQLLWFEYLQS